MKRTLQEYMELAVFAVIALTAGTGLLWVLGQVLIWVGRLSKLLAKFIFIPLRYLVLIAIIVIAGYLIVQFLRSRNTEPQAKPAELVPSKTGASEQTVPETQPHTQSSSQPSPPMQDPPTTD